MIINDNFLDISVSNYIKIMKYSSLPSVISDPNLDLSSLLPTTSEEAKDLWNSMFKIIPHQYPLSAQKTMATLRLSSLKCLQNSSLSLNLDAKWMRASKAFIDIQNYELAKECLSYVEVQETTQTKTKLNFYLWKGQIEFYSELDYLSTFENLIPLCKEMSHERFRITRFLYVEVCGKLQTMKKYSEMVKVLRICLDIGGGEGGDSDCSLKDIIIECYGLLAECYVEVGVFEKAEKLLVKLEQTNKALLLEFKMHVYSNSNERALVVFRKMVGILNFDVLNKAVQLLLSKGKNLDACKCLSLINEKCNDSSFYVTWFKILFALEVVGQMNSSYEYLNINKVLGYLKGFKSTEYLKLLWDYIQEIFHKGKYLEAIQITDEFFIPFVEKPQKNLAVKLVCNSWLGLNNPEESWKALQGYSEDLLGTHFRLMIRLGRFREIDLTLFEKIDFDDLVQILKDLFQASTTEFQETMEKVGIRVVQGIENLEHRMNLLQWLCFHDPDPEHLFEYFGVLRTFHCEKAEWFGIQAWNLSIDQTEPRTKLAFMRISIELLQTLDPVPLKYQQILYNTCKYALSNSFSQFYLFLYKSLQTFTPAPQDNDYYFLSFEFSLIFNDPLPVITSISLENLKDLSKIAQKHNKYQASKDFLQQSLSMKTDHEGLKEMLKICESLEESEKYLGQAIEFYNNENRDEAEWVIAHCWNNAIACPNIFQNAGSKQWLKYALTISVNTHSPYYERILSMYNRINVM